MASERSASLTVPRESRRIHTDSSIGSQGSRRNSFTSNGAQRSRRNSFANIGGTQLSGKIRTESSASFDIELGTIPRQDSSARLSGAATTLGRIMADGVASIGTEIFRRTREGSTRQDGTASTGTNRSVQSVSANAMVHYREKFTQLLHDRELNLELDRGKHDNLLFRRTSMLLCVPLFGASRGVGFKWAQGMSEDGVPTCIPSLGASLVLLPILLTLLAWRHGPAAVKQCASRKYLKMALGGSFNGLAKCLAFASIRSLSPVMQDVLMQSGMLFLLVINTVFLQRMPKSTTCIVTVLVIALASLFVLVSQGDAAQGWRFEAVGIIYGLGAALCEVSGDALIEYAAMSCEEKTDDSSAEVLRVLVMNEIWKLPVTVASCFFFDSKYIWSASPTGWASYLLVGGVLPLCLHVGFGNLCIALYGSVRVNLAASLRVLLIYACEVFVLRLTALDGKLVLILVSLVAALVLNIMIDKDTMDAHVRGELETLKVCREASESLLEPSLGPLPDSSKKPAPVPTTPATIGASVAVSV